MKRTKRIMRKIRQVRVRKRVAGTEARPRLNVYRSLSHFYAQVIDDNEGKTLVAASTLVKEFVDELKGKNKKDQAKLLGKKFAERCIEKNIRQVVFDRAGFIYHGRVAAFAEGAREGGLDF
ncbi:50S ribosomal protein L18 [Myxococcota bacterium]|nr:50S ribosomal protein L18 [Myxococcota bacterium]MBU1382616.1 50S ribosomal protein L18 [Myxococcota bacterium]MBU1495833.1 50S ribosomal protein L18 [Myxococcota bacterium]